nr:phosphate ABC transporter permease PstA [Gallibacter intestinalis]
MSMFLNICMKIAIIFTVGILAFLIGYILIMGIPNISPELFAWEFTTDNQSMMPAIINTLIMTLLTLVIALPFGIGAAIYLVEYARQSSPIVKIVRITAETLSGVPSIVFGLFGFLMFGIAFGWNYSLMSGAMTLAIMVLPVIMRTTEEALLGVPDSYREASFGLGAGKLRTIFRITLPSAMPGIIAGVILSIGRIVGETAALLFTAGTVASIPSSVFDSTRTLAVHLYALLNEGLYMEQAYATAVVLMVVVILINWLSNRIAKKLAK